jgi:arabinan endo-1,5-alpha-L-arabinosidase
MIVGVIGLAAAGAGCAGAATTPHAKHAMRNGLTGAPLSCPDPTVIRAHRGRWNYFVVCTSDNSVNAFPIYKSADFANWYPDGSVLPHGHQPSWAVQSTGHSHHGLYWGPSIYRIHNRWVLYFAAQYNEASHAVGSFKLKPYTMVLGVTTASSLAGPWHTKMLHFPGQLNQYNPAPSKEEIGGDIDPGLVRDPRTGQLDLFWAEQRGEVWESTVSPDGLTVAHKFRLAFNVSEPWECDGAKGCTVEGPQPLYHDGDIYVLYSAASAWDYSYTIGVARAAQALDPANPFTKLPKPILKSANGFIGPGGESAPVVGPNGQSDILYHAMLKLHTGSAGRVLMVGSLHWIDGWPLINDGGTE